MKVFRVIIESTNDKSKEITEVTRYVTARDDSLLSVVAHFTKYCEEYEKDLKCVAEVLTIVENI